MTTTKENEMDATTPAGPVAWIVMRMSTEYSGQGVPLRIITDRAERDIYAAILSEADEYHQAGVEIIEVPLGTGFLVFAPEDREGFVSGDDETLADLRARLTGDEPLICEFDGEECDGVPRRRPSGRIRCNAHLTLADTAGQ